MIAGAAPRIFVSAGEPSGDLLGGALIAVASLGDASPALQGVIALLGGAVAAGSHVTKAGTRVAANTSPEPFSNWFLSLAEDAFVIGLSFLTLKFPLIALGISIAILLLMVVVARKIWKWLRPDPGLKAGAT